MPCEPAWMQHQPGNISTGELAPLGLLESMAPTRAGFDEELL